eukprot:CAMPEP_0171109374 /NCGR_PEP_ID=MMETSP0766_2-20121228/70742_1 /TAXON_ID=439317 /ORGANISM="Gambierdiscus australes, Strain CAWD 149" /LENGTH=48 /DNA_ID= /DNA_START= /DNA_END= /DNA_ORIENTATION=
MICGHAPASIAWRAHAAWLRRRPRCPLPLGRHMATSASGPKEKMNMFQ